MEKKAATGKSKFTADERTKLVTLAWLAGATVSECDKAGGDRESAKEADALKTAVTRCFLAYQVRTDENLLQIMDRRVSKAVALQVVAKHYGVKLENVMAIGDAPNDVAMLQVSGVAVAMDNAHPLVKQAAHWVAPSNNDHGVHAALVRYGLCT